MVDRALVSAGVWGGMGLVATRLQTLVLGVTSARLLGADEYGAFVSLVSILYLCVTIADFGFAGWIQRAVAAREEELQTALLRMGLVLRWTLLPFLFSVASICFGLGLQSLGLSVLGAGAVWMLLALAAGVKAAALMGSERYRRAALAQVGSRLFVIICLIAMSASGIGGLTLIVVVLASGEILAMLFMRTPSKRALRPRSSARLIGLVPFAAMNFANTAYGRVDVPLVLLVLTPTVTSQYAAFSQLQSLLIVAPAILAQGVLSYSARMSLSGDGGRSAAVTVWRLALLSCATGIAVAIGAALLAPTAIRIAYGINVDAIAMLGLVYFATIPLYALHSSLIPFVIAKGKVNFAGWLVWVSLGSMVAAMLPLSFAFGVYGAATAVVIRDFVMAVGAVWVWIHLRRSGEGFGPPGSNANGGQSSRR